MKNIHILPTDKPSRLVLDDTTQQLILINKGEALWGNRNIYITNDSEIKEGDWYLTFLNKEVIGKPRKCEDSNWNFSGCKKIILTTDTDLIKDGVQAIDDEFLEWFVKNPSCEGVEVQKWSSLAECGYSYHIIIPKEEPKHETVEEDLLDTAIQVVGSNNVTTIREFLIKHKWQQEQDKDKFNEEEVLKIIQECKSYLSFGDEFNEKEWFEQFKKK